MITNVYETQINFMNSLYKSLSFLGVSVTESQLFIWLFNLANENVNKCILCTYFYLYKILYFIFIFLVVHMTCLCNAYCIFLVVHMTCLCNVLCILTIVRS